MLKRKFKNAAFVGKSDLTEKNTGVSETVPDQTMSIREILRRYATGTLPDIMSGDLEYSEDNPDLRGLDISQLHEMKLQAKQDIADIQEELNSRKKKKVDPSPTKESPIVNDVQPEKIDE